MSNITTVDCTAGYIYQARAQIPVAGKLATPTELGEVTGLKFRLSATYGGPAINPLVDDLTPAENADEIGLFEVTVSQALQEAYLLPLGRGTKYYGVWSKVGVARKLVDTFVVATGTTV